jgi:serine/threonine protein kinase
MKIGEQLSMDWRTYSRSPISIINEITHSLQLVHRAKYLHCDIRPANVIIFTNEIGEKRAQLIDFGLSCKMDNLSDIRHTNYKINKYSHQAKCVGRRIRGMFENSEVDVLDVSWENGDDYEMLMRMIVMMFDKIDRDSDNQLVVNESMPMIHTNELSLTHKKRKKSHDK